MHELHRAQSILDSLTRLNVERPVTIKLSHLKTTQIMLEEVIECFDIVTEKSPLKGSKLEFIANDTVLQCADCQQKHIVTRNNVPEKCIKCGSKNLELNDDDELTLLSFSPNNN